MSFDRSYVEFRRPSVFKSVNLISPRNRCHAAVKWHIWCFTKFLKGCTIFVPFIIIYQHRITGDESITASCLHHRNAVENICLTNIHCCLFRSMINIIMNTGKRGCHYQYTGGRIWKVNLPWCDTMQQCKPAKSKWLIQFGRGIPSNSWYENRCRYSLYSRHSSHAASVPMMFRSEDYHENKLAWIQVLAIDKNLCLKKNH